MMNLQRLQENLQYTFRDEALLRLALTHCSYPHRTMDESSHNQRLEFLGDAVLQLYSSTLLYARFPQANESMLSHARAALVCEQALAVYARALHVGPCLLLGNGEIVTGGADRDSILADAMEAIIGAVYLDGGEKAAKTLIERLLLPGCDRAIRPEKRLDAKTTLQLACQDAGDVHYAIVGQSGPDHAKHFVAQALLGDRVIGQGEGTSKKHAERSAALDALSKLESLKNKKDEKGAE